MQNQILANIAEHIREYAKNLREPKQMPTPEEMSKMTPEEQLAMREQIARGYANTSVGGVLGGIGRGSESMAYRAGGYAQDSLSGWALNAGMDVLGKGARSLAGKVEKKTGIKFSARIPYKNAQAMPMAQSSGMGSGDVGTAIEKLSSKISTETTQIHSDNQLKKIDESLKGIRINMVTDKHHKALLAEVGLITKTQKETNMVLNRIEDVFVEDKLDRLEREKEASSAPTIIGANSTESPSDRLKNSLKEEDNDLQDIANVIAIVDDLGDVLRKGKAAALVGRAMAALGTVLPLLASVIPFIAGAGVIAGLGMLLFSDSKNGPSPGTRANPSKRENEAVPLFDSKGKPVLGGTDFLESEEGFKDRVYNDVGKEAIGFGHNITKKDKERGFLQTASGKGVPLARNIKDTVITKEQARDVMKFDLAQKQKEVVNLVGQEAWDKANENQKTAILSYAYNTGSGKRAARGEKGSGVGALVDRGLAEALSSGDTEKVSSIIASGVKTTNGGTVFNKGLAKRRNKEAALAMKPVVETEKVDTSAMSPTMVTESRPSATNTTSALTKPVAEIPNKMAMNTAINKASDKLEEIRAAAKEPVVAATPPVVIGGGSQNQPTTAPINTPQAPRVESPARKRQEADLKI